MRFGAQEHHRILRYVKICAYLSIVYERYGQEDFESDDFVHQHQIADPHVCPGVVIK